MTLIGLYHISGRSDLYVLRRTWRSVPIAASGRIVPYSEPHPASIRGVSHPERAYSKQFGLLVDGGDVCAARICC